MPIMKPKAIVILLSDGATEITVHEPLTGDLGTFLRAIPALSAMQKVFQSMMEDAGTIPQLPEDVFEGIYPLLAVMTEYNGQPISMEDFKSLPMWDSMEIMKAFNKFNPKVAGQARKKQQESQVSAS